MEKCAKALTDKQQRERNLVKATITSVTPVASYVMNFRMKEGDQQILVAYLDTTGLIEAKHTK